MNLKITKKIISILCAATVTVPSIGSSVGAIEAYHGNYASFAEPSADLTKAVYMLKHTLKSSTDTITESINLANNCIIPPLEALMKIVTIQNCLEKIETKMTKWNDFSIENINLVNETNFKINSLNLNKITEDLKGVYKDIDNNIDKLDSITNDLSETLKIIEEINIKLEEENNRLLSKEFNDNNFYLLNENKQKEENDNNFYLLNENKQKEKNDNNFYLLNENKQKEKNDNKLNLINNSYNTFCLLDDSK